MEEQPQAVWIERIVEIDDNVVPIGKPTVKEAWRAHQHHRDREEKDGGQ